MKVYRVKKDYVLEVADTNQSTLEFAFKNGFTFVKWGESFYILNTTKSRKMLHMQLVDVDIV